MKSKIDRKTGNLDFCITIPEDERRQATITRERFLELLNDDLKSEGYEITEVDNDFLGGTSLTIKTPDGGSLITHGKKLTPVLKIKLK